MLTIVVPGAEMFDEKTQTFSYTKDTTLRLEHSLVSISKWESHFKKPFISKEQKTNEEVIYYVKCMTLTQNVPPIVYDCLSEQNFKDIDAYIDDSMTATWFSEEESTKKVQREVITSEIIYYWMIALSIPIEFQKWHLNRLLTLINVCNIKNQPPKKMSKNEVLSRTKTLNTARRNQLKHKR